MFRFPILLALAVIFMPSAARAMDADLQCVPYARALTGVEIRGDAHTWWGQAKGRYERGSQPRVGAVMSFKPHGSSRLGHVAAVRKIIDDRTILISHANWSRINGKRGHIEENVKVVDSSKRGDWSRVRVWYTPNNALGGTSRPLNGFIYPEKLRSDSQARKALASLIGQRARITPAAESAAFIRMADAGAGKKARAPAKRHNRPRKIKRFSLSRGTLADVNRKAVSEAAAAKGQPASGSPTKADVIAEILGSIDD